MPENQVRVTITLSDPELKEEELLKAVKNLQSEADNIQGVEADLISIAEAPPGSKSLGTFLIDTFKAVVNIKKLPNLLKTLSHRLIGGQKIKIKAEGNNRKLDIEVGSPEDVAKIMPEIDKFING
ncbi:MAG: hypothetical protein QNJ54_11940 [Prochloraceae cyanobacterium]|nr:hypothetical protein [Prochloraceae cyanobacterium]